MTRYSDQALPQLEPPDLVAEILASRAARLGA
jgi:hypothetical protein